MLPWSNVRAMGIDIALSPFFIFFLCFVFFVGFQMAMARSVCGVYVHSKSQNRAISKISEDEIEVEE